MGTLRQVTVGIASLAALGTSFAAGVSVGDDARPKGRDQVAVAAGIKRLPTGSQPAVLAGALTSATSCDELLKWYVAEGIKRVGPYGWDSLIYNNTDMMVFEDSAPTAMTASRAQASSSQKAAIASATGTNVQEAGVDEPDVVKTNGTIVARIKDDRLTTYDVTGTAPEQLASVHLADITEAEMLLVGDYLVVLGKDDQTANLTNRTRMIQLDVSDPGAPVVTNTKVFSSALVSATQHGTTVRLTMSQGLPDLNFTQPRRWRNEKAALKRNQKVVRESKIEDWLPNVSDGDVADTEPVSLCTSVAIPEEDSGLGTLSIVGFDVNSPESWDVAAVTTESQIAYASSDHLYLATTAGWSDECCWEDWGMRGQSTSADGVTDLHAFALDGIATTYVGSGEVEGRIADRWSMDESDGVLRVAVGATNATGNFNSVVTLALEGDQLTEVGRLDKLGVNEDIQSMRWFDSLAIMVTFRQVDPLYAIDLSERQPRLLGELKIPGFSDYLHPIGPERIIGMGVDATLRGRTRGAQAGLFNLADIANPRLVSKLTYGPRAQALAGEDPRQFTWLPDQRTALTVVAKGYDSRTGFISVLKLVDGEFQNRMVEVEYGDEVSEVRLVPLTSGPSSGKVVLVTGDDLRFFSI